MDANNAFATLKKAMTTTPILRLLDFALQFMVETNASNIMIGAVLMQLGQPIAYFSLKMRPRMHEKSAYLKELYAITEAV